jgi:aspartyl-tRNA(Asn)/glutamyl-tRNA(Gln) amidotransferase subunit A
MEEEICELSTGLRRGSLTAEALLDRCLERIRQLDPQLNSFVALDEAGARAATRGLPAGQRDRRSMAYRFR